MHPPMQYYFSGFCCCG